MPKTKKNKDKISLKEKAIKKKEIAASKRKSKEQENLRKQRELDYLKVNATEVKSRKNSPRFFRNLNKQEQDICNKVMDSLESKNSRLSNYYPFDENMKRVIQYHSYFIRPIEDFKPIGKSPKKHFVQLVNHLFCKYPMPTFWENVWESRFGSQWCFWFICVAQGESIQKSCPLPITKKEAHRFMQSESCYHPAEALRISQFISNGGEMSSVHGILSLTTIVDDTWNPREEREEFYMELFRWFAANPMLDTARFLDIYDWTMYKKYRADDDEIQPNMKMKGRTVDAVLREVNQWHQRVNRQNIVRKYASHHAKVWDGILIRDWSYSEKSKNSVHTWTIGQITTLQDLREEGSAQSHCVGSYHSSCASGSTSIWSLKLNRDRQVTLEIRDRTIVQAKGKRNASLTDNQRKVIERFANERNLQMGRYIR